VQTELALEALEVENIVPSEVAQTQNEEWINVTASVDNNTSATPLAEIVKKHNRKLEEIQMSNVSSKESGKMIKDSEKQFKKEVKVELKKEIKEIKAGDGDYTLMMILGILIAPLGVGLTYGITTEFWISLILFLVFWLPGAIYDGIKVHQFFKG